MTLFKEIVRPYIAPLFPLILQLMWIWGFHICTKTCEWDPHNTSTSFYFPLDKKDPQWCDLWHKQCLTSSWLRPQGWWVWSQIWGFGMFWSSYVRNDFCSSKLSLLLPFFSTWHAKDVTPQVQYTPENLIKGLASDFTERKAECVHVKRWVHFPTSSLRSDPALCMYHLIWACWDLGIHSRNVELLFTPKRTLSSTCPPPRPNENKVVSDARVFPLILKGKS